MNIEFSTHSEYYRLEQDFPTPIKLNIPEWFKKLEHGTPCPDVERLNIPLTRTIKGCMPFLETLTSGYLLKLPVDYKVEHGVKKDKEGKPVSNMYTALNTPGGESQYIAARGINIANPNCHPIDQLEGSPFVKQNGNLPFQKILNPWRIKTPKGYSCLFVNPLNNPPHDYFHIMSGIVHTDKYPQEVNFPIVINAEKYKALDTIIAKGTPYVQIIPFKRDDWKMTTKSITDIEIKKRGALWSLTFRDIYKNLFWNKDKTSWS